MTSCRLITDKIWANLEQKVLQASQSNCAAFLAWLYACICYNKLAQASCRKILYIRTMSISEASDPRLACGKSAACFFPQKY